MRALYYYIVAIIFLGAGIPLTYFGYEDGVNVENNDDTGYSLMMVFGLLFLLISVIIFSFGVLMSLREKREK